MIVAPLLFTAADVDASAELHASGTIDASCAYTSDGHLPAGSPCIDAGTATEAPLLDIDGQVRDASPERWCRRIRAVTTLAASV